MNFIIFCNTNSFISLESFFLIKFIEINNFFVNSVSVETSERVLNLYKNKHLNNLNFTLQLVTECDVAKISHKI